jgi:CubicO group peptidase (beta-lactamase class C family)
MKQSLVFLFLLTLGISYGQQTPSKSALSIQLDSLILQEHAADRFHGSLQLTSHDSTVYSKSIGLANRSWNVPMTMQTSFDIASLNKSFIAALWVIAEKEGKAKLKTKLNTLLNRFQYNTRFDPDITVHQMIIHTSGLPDYNALPSELKQNNYQLFKKNHFSKHDYVDLIAQLAPVSKPNTNFHYSNFAYHILAFLLEDLYERSFDELLQEKICEPLGLVSTVSYTNNQQLIPNLAAGYSYVEGKWLKNNYIDLSLGRRIFSTTEDLNKWAYALCDTPLFDQGQLELISSNHLNLISEQISYGYGWSIHPQNSPYTFGNLDLTKPYLIHGGATEGYRSLVVIVNKGEYVLSFLSNVGQKTNELELAQKIFDLLKITNEN